MIRLDRIELLHWDIQAHQSLPLARGVTMLTGENGSGKTSILDAIKVGLGARRLRGGRSIEDYLLKRAAPRAMVRLVVDNRPDGRRRRPFDQVGSFGEDAVTLAVVFEADNQGDYQRHFYMIDGDRVPERVRADSFVDGGEQGRLDGGGAYRERLDRVGVGREYRRLLGQPQGEIASLCRHDGEELFRRIYDIIGGQEVLEQWKERLEEAERKRAEFEEAQDELRAARNELEALEQKAERHREFRERYGRLEVLEKLLPHLRVERVREEVGELEERLDERESERAERREQVDQLTETIEQFEAERDELEEREETLGERRAEIRRRRDEIHERFVEVRREHEELRELRNRAEEIDPVDPAELKERGEQIDADLAEGRAARREREAELDGLRGELARIEEGLMPIPDEVADFKTILQRHDVPHYLLFEVVEVDDEDWAPAIESFLGRYRFAVLVTNMERWRRAAELAREHEYPYGVLAPDYRGRSKYDERGLYPRMTVNEDDYAQLVARLVRHVEPAEPDEPVEPPERRRRVLADDGFLVSRIEARQTRADDHYLGRRARERRRRKVEERIETLEEETRQWEGRAEELREQREALERRLERQKIRLEWERRREELSEVASRRTGLEDDLERLAEREQRFDEEWEEVHDDLRRIDSDLGARRNERESVRDELDKLEGEVDELQEQLGRARARLGELRADDLPELTDEEMAEVDDVASVEAAEASIEQLRRQIAEVPEEVRDKMVVENYERQKETVQRVERRLEERRRAHEETRQAAEQARDQYHRVTRRRFRAYFAQLEEAGERLGFEIDGELDPREDGNFRCVVRLSVGDKPPVHHASEDLSGGEKAALSILMGMTAVSLNSEGAGFFLIDEPFHHSDIHKINELGDFLARSGAQYLVSMPTSADLEECGEWLDGVWVCTKAAGGWGDEETPEAPPLKVSFASDPR